MLDGDKSHIIFYIKMTR